MGQVGSLGHFLQNQTTLFQNLACNVITSGRSMKSCPGTKCFKLEVPEWVNPFFLNRNFSEVNSFILYHDKAFSKYFCSQKGISRDHFFLPTAQDQLQLCNSISLADWERRLHQCCGTEQCQHSHHSSAGNSCLCASLCSPRELLAPFLSPSTTDRQHTW